jgi:hypothetical protein
VCVVYSTYCQLFVRYLPLLTVTGDGFDDIIVGAPGADPKGRDGEGVAYVIFGGGGEAAGFKTLDMLNFTSSDSSGYVIQVCIKPYVTYTFICYICVLKCIHFDTHM